MNKYFVHTLLLFSLLFNIAHASIIAAEDTCEHESAHEFVLEQAHSSECGDLCDMHHLFHFMAILTDTSMVFNNTFSKEILTAEHTLYTPPFQERSTKPPIA